MENSFTPPPNSALRIGDWSVNQTTGQIVRGQESFRAQETDRLEARTLRLLLCLAERPGQIVSIDDLLTRVWPDVTVSPDSVYQAIASLRRQLGDDPRQPTYIATVPRLGYQMVASVSALPDLTTDAAQGSVAAQTSPHPPPVLNSSHTRRKAAVPAAIAVALCLVLLAGFLIHSRAANKNPAALSGIPVQTEKSIAVLPFLDLTQGMKEEEFADGMTEELIDKLAKVPGLRVPPPTSSFVYKGKQVPIAEIARSLGVAYILDGSVRKDGTWVRIATRLVRADNGYVAWSETYDRPFKDILAIQDDIANAVTKALTQSIATNPSGTQAH
ncbi:MAG TPA: winged helix-turn-helix domain-containing protein [Terracidiphilus sp.]|jgi:TolB-like protein/DNA-binding winged helix-turn-helix (wHTH) protein|nr:winged helix-turn-helix domain-containing protein [Terracidiphilus sp.]